MVSLLLKLNVFSHYVIQSDAFVYQSANFDPRIKILPFLNFAWSGVLKIVQNYLSRCLGSREIGKNWSAHQLDWNLNIPHFKYGVLTTFLPITFQFLILEYRYWYFSILQRLGYWKMYRNTFQDVLEAEEEAKQKWVLCFETPCINLKLLDFSYISKINFLKKKKIDFFTPPPLGRGY